MSTIQIPSRFENVLKQSSGLLGAVNQTFTIFEPWLQQSGMPFFPGYTDHSTQHINDVLKTASSLISDDSHALLTPEDVAVLCIAVLLHDCGMHLTQDSFRCLIQDKSLPSNLMFSDQSWFQLWEDFLAEARRYGQDKLVDVFGDTQPVDIDSIDYENLSERDCLLIGEFVRRHHTRLAHEIAINGVPSNNPVKLKVQGLNEDLRDIAGLIARSHGMRIRDTFQYIEDIYSIIPEQLDVKGPYLMAVLRIADYIQVKSERALKSLLSVKELRSPISRQEWNNHFAVKNISQSHKDPEAFFVTAAPVDVKTYLRLVDLFKDIQRELDESWATIGEVYGYSRLNKLSQLGLTIRRIRSNLDSKSNFAKSVTYVPVRAGFDASGPELLKLLVGPLYAYDLTIGIRELIQNAVDACRELKDSQNNISNQPLNEADVVVDFQENNDGGGWVRITDKGVGMTLDTVINYFLIAGASFRNSDIWKRSHVSDEGQPRVMRGGRFGVGVLAAFLLGDEIKVKTRYHSRPDTEGLEFRARIDDPTVELRRCVAEAGTTIEIFLTEDVINQLRPYISSNDLDPNSEMELTSWDKVDWFVQSSPKVKIIWNGYNTNKYSEENGYPRFKIRASFTPTKQDFPNPGEKTISWIQLPNPGTYKDIYWKYLKPVKKTSGNSTWEVTPNNEIFVNGIWVSSHSNYERLKVNDKSLEPGPFYRISRPSIAIFDPLGVCPLNLQRSQVAFDRMDIDNVLARSVLEKHLIRFRRQASSSITFDEITQLCKDFKSNPDIDFEGLISHIGITNAGFFIADPYVINQLGIKKLYLINATKFSSKYHLKDILNDDEALILRGRNEGIQNDLAWFRGLMSFDKIDSSWYSRGVGIPLMAYSATLLITSISKWNFVNEKKRVKQQLLKSLITLQLPNNDIAVISGDEQKAESVVKRTQSIQKNFDEMSEIACCILDSIQPSQVTSGSSMLSQVWFDVNKKSYHLDTN